MNLEISTKHLNLEAHPMYQSLVTLDNVKTFMKYHVFAVWDFMSLLKSLQREVTCVTTPWTSSSYSAETVRLINEIVLGEESDVDQDGEPISHFSLYLRAMEEVGADTSLITGFLKNFDFEQLPLDIKHILAFHLDLAESGEVHQVASSFFFGREKLIPSMFTSILNVLKQAQLHCPSLIYYLERHIEVDSADHGPKALQCLNTLIDTHSKKEEVIQTANRSLEMRWKLWDFIHSEMCIN